MSDSMDMGTVSVTAQADPAGNPNGSGGGGGTGGGAGADPLASNPGLTAVAVATGDPSLISVASIYALQSDAAITAQQLANDPTAPFAAAMAAAPDPNALAHVEAGLIGTAVTIAAQSLGATPATAAFFGNAVATSINNTPAAIAALSAVNNTVADAANAAFGALAAGNPGLGSDAGMTLPGYGSDGGAVNNTWGH